MDPNYDLLRREIEGLRAKVVHLRDAKSLNEQTTKSALITPMLAALGWHVTNPEEVHYEYRRRTSDSPVDYALMLQRTPCLFVEAKAIGQNLDDSKWAKQSLGYSMQSGVSWIVLTNGVEYRVYNAHAPVPLNAKLFKKFSLADSPIETLVDAFALLTKENFIGKRIDRAWETYHVHTQVKQILERLVRGGDSSAALARLIAKRSDGKLTPKVVQASFKRADVRIDYPPIPTVTPPSSHMQPELSPQKPKAKKNTPSKAKSDTSSDVSVKDLIAAGILKAPVALIAKYLSHELRATILADGTVEVNGKRYPSLSAAGGMARKPLFNGDFGGKEYPATNGWKFWSTLDKQSGKLVSMDIMRGRIQSSGS